MPYKIAEDGMTIMHKKDGKWEVKQKCTSKENAKKALRLLYMKEGEHMK